MGVSQAKVHLGLEARGAPLGSSCLPTFEQAADSVGGYQVTEHNLRGERCPSGTMPLQLRKKIS